MVTIDGIVLTTGGEVVCKMLTVDKLAVWKFVWFGCQPEEVSHAR